MLDINKISHSAVYQTDWRKQRLGHITASLCGKLFGEKSHEGKFTQGATKYIYEIAGEILTGEPSKEEFFTADTNYGNATEPEAVEYFKVKTGKTILRNDETGDTHKLILNDDMTACTPDALVANNPKALFNSEGTHLNVSPFETKCPPNAHRFIKLFRCNTPLELKKEEPLYYYQCLAQLIWTDSLTGYFAPYHPKFPVPMKIIEFKKMELISEVKLFNATIKHAKAEIRKVVEMFKPNQL